MSQNEKARLMKLGYSEAEALELIAYDNEVEHGKPTKFDLTAEQEKVSKQARGTGTRKTVYQFTKRERKPNELKRLIIAEAVKFLTENKSIQAENVTASNIERMIDFEIDGISFSLMLTQHRSK